MSSKEFLMCPRERDDYICLMEELGMPYETSDFNWSDKQHSDSVEGNDDNQHRMDALIADETQNNGSNSHHMQFDRLGSSYEFDPNLMEETIVAMSSSENMDESLNFEKNNDVSSSMPQQYSRIVRLGDDEFPVQNYLDRYSTAEEFERELCEDYERQESSFMEGLEEDDANDDNDEKVENDDALFGKQNKDLHHYHKM